MTKRAARPPTPGHRGAQKRTRRPPGRKPRNVAIAARQAEQARQAADLDERRKILERLGLDEFDEVDKTILGIVLARPAVIDRDVAAVVGLSREQVNRRRNREKFRRALSEAQMDTLALIQRSQAPAARELGALVGNSDPQIRLRAARELVGPIIRRQEEVGGGADAFATLLDDAAKWRAENRAKPAEVAP